MYEPQHFVDLQENAGGFGGDSSSWLAGDDQSSSPTRRRTQSSFSNATSTGAANNLDRVLLKDLVEIVPLVQSLLTDRKASTSFTRRGSMIYTKTPARESLYKKTTEAKGRHAAQSIPTKKRRDPGDNQGKNAGDNHDGCADGFSFFSSRALPSEEREELVALREQVEDLQRKLSEKDELLKSAEISKNQMISIHAKLDELKHQASEKDSVLKSTQLQLSDAKIKLADKQAALEKLQWEAMNSNKQVEKLQEEVNTMQTEMSSFMLLFEGLTENNYATSSEDYDVNPYHSDHPFDVDDLDENEMQKMEEAREAYIAAVAVAKEKQDEGSIAAAASARLYLQSFVLRSRSMNASNGSPCIAIPRAASETLAH